MLCVESFVDEHELSKHGIEAHRQVRDISDQDKYPLKNVIKARKFEIPAPLNVLPLTPTVKVTFKCFICPNSYYNEGAWSEHEKAEHRRKCDEIFITESEVTEHKKICHEEC